MDKQMKIIKLGALMLSVLTASQAFGWAANRPTRYEAGLPNRPELPSGSYFNDCTNCTVGIARLDCEKCGKKPKYGTAFYEPFKNCAQDGCHDLSVGEYGEDGSGLMCVDTCRRRPSMLGWKVENIKPAEYYKKITDIESK
jgi:hypothetical protein